MARYYRKSLFERIEQLEKKVTKPKNPLLFIELNDDGTYGEDNLTEKQLDQYIKENGYSVVFIDDIPKTDD